MSEPPRPDLPTPDDCITIINTALADRDWDGVYAAMMALAVQDPHRAEKVRDTMLLGLELAQQYRPRGRNHTDMAAEPQTTAPAPAPAGFTLPPLERLSLENRLGELDSALRSGNLTEAARALDLLAGQASTIADRIRQAAAGAATPPAVDGFSREIVDLCIEARIHNYGQPFATWSGREQAAVALVLDNTAWLRAAGYHTRNAALRDVADGMMSPPADMNAWVAQLRAEVDAR